MASSIVVVLGNRIMMSACRFRTILMWDAEAPKDPHPMLYAEGSLFPLLYTKVICLS